MEVMNSCLIDGFGDVRGGGSFLAVILIRVRRLGLFLLMKISNIISVNYDILKLWKS